MAMIIRNSGEERGLVPFYGPVDTMAEIDQLARGFWETWMPLELDTCVIPHTDMYEEDGKIVVETELPGMKKDDIKIELDGDTLTIRAEKKEKVKKDAGHHTRERFFGEYYQSLTLPYPVDEEKIEARYLDGVLEVTLPKGKEVQARKIEVKGELPKGEGKPKTKKIK